MVKVTTKRKKFDPAPGTYFLLKFPDEKYQRYTHRLVYILDVYKVSTSKTGKQLKQPYKRCTCIQVNFFKEVGRYDKRPYEAQLKDQMLQLVKRDITHSSRYHYRNEDDSFTESPCDLTFVVKYGGPNVIVREVLERLERRQKAWADKVVARLALIQNNLTRINGLLKGETNEKAK